MAEDSDLEKTEHASPRRLQKAREEGDVPRSKELATVSGLLAAGIGLLFLSDQLSDALKTYLSSGLHFERVVAFDANTLFAYQSQAIFKLTLAFAPFALLLLFVALASPALIGGWVFNTKAIVPNFTRLNPMRGLGNLVSKYAAIELVKAIAKTLLVGLVAYLVVAHDLKPILSLPSLSVSSGIAQVGHLMQIGFLLMVGGLVIVAAIDVPYQLYHYANKLKMTKEELRQEAKESEGNPEIKARIRQQQREMAKRRMMSEIPKADVVITNPTHYAVAVKYKEDGMRAPVVVAKGADAVALKIREIASEHQVPTLESPKLARALFAHTELGDEIPEALYAAVAEVLAYVFQMRIFKREGGYRPELPRTLPVPEALDPHSLLPAPTIEPEVFPG